MIEAAFVLLLICLCCRPGLSRRDKAYHVNPRPTHPKPPPPPSPPPVPKAFYTNTTDVPPLPKVPRPPPLPGARRGGGA